MSLYADIDYYKNIYKGNSLSEENDLTKYLQEATDDVNTLTFNRIIGKGFENLTDFQKDIIQAIEDTKDFPGMILNLAINYGGRDEIIRCIKKIIKKGISEEEITEKEPERRSILYCRCLRNRSLRCGARFRNRICGPAIAFRRPAQGRGDDREGRLRQSDPGPQQRPPSLGVCGAPSGGGHRGADPDGA